MKRLNKPIVTKETFKNMEDMSWFIHTKIFDDLLIVAQKETNCFVLKTTEGLIVIDAIWPSYRAFNAIIDAVINAGWEPDSIKKLVITHGHKDHTGCGKQFIEKYNVETYLSETDDNFWEINTIKPYCPETGKDFDITVYVKDGDTITLGNKTIYVYDTPGHTPGCLSYIFPVTENESVYMAALWGGTTPPRTVNGCIQYLKSLDYFMEKAYDKKVEVALSNHTSVDNGLERIIYSKARMAYMPNIYIIGEEGFRKYCQAFRNMSYDVLEELLK